MNSIRIGHAAHPPATITPASITTSVPTDTDGLLGGVSEHADGIDRGRRAFLCGMGSAAAFLATNAIAGMFSGCRRTTSAGAEDTVSSVLRMGGNGVPRVAFVPMKRYPVPEFPPEVLPQLSVDEVAKRFSIGLEKTLTVAKRREVPPAVVSRYVLDLCRDILVRIHPAFDGYIRRRFVDRTDARDAFFEYVNALLVQRRLYLFIRDAHKRVGAHVDLYKLMSSYRVLIDDIDEAAMHFMEGGVVGTSSAGASLGSVTSTHSRTVTMRTSSLDAVVHRVDRLRDWYNFSGTASAVLRGAMYHEAIHLYVERLFASRSKRFPVDLSRYRIDVGGLWLYLDGRYDYEQIHELAAVGGELATARDVSQVLIYLLNDGWNYQLARLALQILIIKHMDRHIEIKRRHVANMRPPYTDIDWRSLVRYFRSNNDVELANRIGLEMFKRAMAIFEGA